MRFAMMPIFYGSTNLFSISNPNFFSLLCRGLEANGIQFEAILFLPEEGLDYDLTEVQRRFPNTEVVTYPLVLTRANRYVGYYEECTIPKPIFDLLTQSDRKSRCIDFFLTSRAALCDMLQAVISFRSVRTIGVSIPVVWFSNDLCLLEKSAQFQVTPFDVDVDMLATTHAIAQFPIEYERASYLKECRIRLAPSFVQRRLEQSFVEFPPLDFGRVDEIRQQVEARQAAGIDRVTFFYGGSLAGKKQFPEMYKIVDQIYCSGKDVRFRITTQVPEQKVEIDGQPTSLATDFAKITWKCDQKRFFEAMVEGDVFMCLTKNESVGAAYFEMLMAGMIGVFWKRPWLKGLVPADYPFQSDSLTEVYDICRWIASNFDRAKMQFVKSGIMEHIRNTMDWKIVSKRWWERVDGLIDGFDTEYNDSLRGKTFPSSLIARWAETAPPEFSLDDVYAAISTTSDSGIDLKKRIDIVTKQAVRKAVLMQGFEDVGTWDDMRFRRRQ